MLSYSLDIAIDTLDSGPKASEVGGQGVRAPASLFEKFILAPPRFHLATC